MFYHHTSAHTHSNTYKSIGFCARKMTQTKVGKKPNHVSNIFNRRDFFWAKFFSSFFLSPKLRVKIRESPMSYCVLYTVEHQFTFHTMVEPYARILRFYEKCICAMIKRYNMYKCIRCIGIGRSMRITFNRFRFDRSNGPITITTTTGKLVGNKLIQLICFHSIALAILFRQ